VSSRPFSPIVSYAWDFTDDGVDDATGGPASADWTFPSAGRRLVRVRVTTADGRSASDKGGLDVKAAPTPSVTATLSASPTAATLDQVVTLTATATPNSSAGAVTRYEWDFTNDGIIDQTTSTPSTTTRYDTVGNKTAKVTAHASAASGSATASVTVTAPALAASLTASTPRVTGSTVTFSSTVTSSGTFPSGLSFEWDFDGNGTTDAVTSGSPSSSAGFTYNVAGTYKPKVTVTAPDGRTTSNTITITVS
jgi:PKD repeat protein